MTSIFVNKSLTHAIRFGMSPEDGGEENAVYIRQHVSLSDVKAIERNSYQMQSVTTANGKGIAQVEVPMSNTQQMLANLRQMIVRWEGPLFEGVPYSDTVLEKLNAAECDWWLELVMDAINALNRPHVDLPEPGTEGNSPLILDGSAT